MDMSKAQSKVQTSEYERPTGMNCAPNKISAAIKASMRKLAKKSGKKEKKEKKEKKNQVFLFGEGPN